MVWEAQQKKKCELLTCLPNSPHLIQVDYLLAEKICLTYGLKGYSDNILVQSTTSYNQKPSIVQSSTGPLCLGTKKGD